MHGFSLLLAAGTALLNFQWIITKRDVGSGQWSCWHRNCPIPPAYLRPQNASPIMAGWVMFSPAPKYPHPNLWNIWMLPYVVKGLCRWNQVKDLEIRESNLSGYVVIDYKGPFMKIGGWQRGRIWQNEEGPRNQGIQGASKSWKKATKFLLKPPEISPVAPMTSRF